MEAYRNKPFSESYRDTVGGKCRELMKTILSLTEAVKYVVAFGKRNIVWELLPAEVEK